MYNKVAVAQIVKSCRERDATSSRNYGRKIKHQSAQHFQDLNNKSLFLISCFINGTAERRVAKILHKIYLLSDLEGLYV
jgi:hypothetical protein